MNRDYFLNDQKLFTPGPTTVPLRIKAAPLLNDLYHRSEDYYALHQACQKMLAPFFGTKQTPIILTCSGTGAMEAAVIHVTNPSDEVLVLKVGKFGERFEKLNRTYGCQVHVIESAAGKSIDPQKLAHEIANLKNIRAVFMQANETSTGVFNPISEIVPIIRKKFPDAFVVVDGISALCAHDVSMDNLGIDILLSGSQKGFGVPPGLAFIALSQRAQEYRSSRPRFYFDLFKEFSEQINGRTSWTPAIAVTQCLHASLTELSQIGVQEVIKHHQLLANATRNAATALGMKLFVEKNYSHALTSIVVPNGVDAAKVLQIARQRYGCIISGGQDELKGKIFRFAHLGMTSSLHLIQGLAAFEFALKTCGYSFTLGSGVSAAMETLARA